MRGLRQERARLVERPGRQEFQEQRQVVRQLVGRQDQPAPLVVGGEVDHRLAAVAALAVDMLEQMQRQPPRLVEEVDVALLEVEEVAPAESGGERRKRRPILGRNQSLRRDGGLDLRQGGDEVLRGIGEHRRQRLERPGGIVAGHHATSIGLEAFFGLLVPKRLVSVAPPEQPLPKEKPQEPRRSALSSFHSRCAVGMTKRSS